MYYWTGKDTGSGRSRIPVMAGQREWIRLYMNRFRNKELYERTGIQKQIFNTIYQLEAVKRQEPELLEKAESLLMLPDYFHYLLTGKKLQSIRRRRHHSL